MANVSTRLNVTPREAAGSRATRRLRRSGLVPGVLYGGGGDSVPISVDGRELRAALHAGSAVLELQLDGKSENAVVKDQQHDPVRGTMMHIDFVRVRMDQPIQALVHIELVGGEKAPGTVEGGVLEQQLRELNVEALPAEIPEVIQHDISELELNGTITLADITPPEGVKLLDDPETVIGSITLPRAEVETTEEVETETAVVGEGEAVPEGAEAPAPEAEGAGEGGQPETTSE